MKSGGCASCRCFVPPPPTVAKRKKRHILIREIYLDSAKSSVDTYQVSLPYTLVGSTASLYSSSKCHPRSGWSLHTKTAIQERNLHGAPVPHQPVYKTKTKQKKADSFYFFCPDDMWAAFLFSQKLFHYLVCVLTVTAWYYTSEPDLVVFSLGA